MNEYYYDGKKVSLTISARHRAVQFATPPTAEMRRSAAMEANTPEERSQGVHLGNGLFLHETNTQNSSMAPAGGVALPSGSQHCPVFESADGTPMIVTREFIAQFSPTMSRAEIDQYNSDNQVRVVSESGWETNTFVLEVQGTESDALGMANRYQEHEQVVHAHPNFVRLMTRTSAPNDQLFSQQWALNNTGQGGGVAGQDIKVLPAWNITKGSSKITIAIIDEGVDYSHPDLNTPGKLVTGYDAVRRINDPTPSNDDAHGTACAGIAAAASNNNLGISGVAPGCRIMGVRIAYGVINPVTGRRVWVTTDAQIADGINQAVANGADVLSNSWGGGSPSTSITNAIRQAKSFGRGGLGCVVCFAAGNENSFVSYPGTLPEVITVAACNEYGERKSPTSRDGERWGSNFGPEVDLAAPGVHIVTSDIRGTSGYERGDYTKTFNGTSAATPHVAAVAALCLSVNPDLRAAEVEDILRHATDDLGQQGYDNYTGYGRINAYKAVLAARTRWDTQRRIPRVIGPEQQAGDVSLGDISRNGKLDLLVFRINNPVGPNHGFYHIGWDLDANGTPASWSKDKSVPDPFGENNQAGGVALANINSNTILDLVVFHIRNPRGQNDGHYRIGWDLDTNGDPTGWSDLKPIPGPFGIENQGGAIAVADLNGDGRPELIVFHIKNPAGLNQCYYRIGWNLNAAGDVTGGWSQDILIPAVLGNENGGGSIAVTDLDGDGRPELIVFYIRDHQPGQNTGHYQIGWKLDRTGLVTGGWSPVQQIPGQFGERSQAAGIAVGDIDGNGRKDAVIYHIKNPPGQNQGYYQIGWNLR